MSQPQLTPIQSRTLGSLLAHHAGDSLGATLEFKSHSQIKSLYPNGLRTIIGGGPFGWSPGHATDDTDMTRGVLLAYRDLHRYNLVQSSTSSSSSKKKFKEDDRDIVFRAADYFLLWFTGLRWPDRQPNSPPPDIGGATATGLSSYAQSRDPSTSGAGPGSAGNGSLMRCLPTALFQPDPNLRREESMKISAVTHDDPRCTVSCAAYNAIVAELVKGSSPGDAVKAGEDVAEELENVDEGQTLKAIQRGRELSIADAAENGPPKDMRGRCSGFVLESLILAVAAVLDSRSLEDTLVDVVRVGKDTDTNGAIAGGLLGARDGVEAIPQEWRDILQFTEEFTDVVLELTKDQTAHNDP